MIEAKIIADSVNASGNRLTTFVLTYPRFIHAEFMTHRMFSRNASSSRAIPVKKQIQMVIDNPAIPLAFTKNKAGMQGGEALTGEAHEHAVDAWLEGMQMAVSVARALERLEIHKQYANRVLEPYAHITVVCSATEYDNFFALRIHEAAQPEIRELAEKMYQSMRNSTPQQILPAQWHLPFITEEDKEFVKTLIPRPEGVELTNAHLIERNNILIKMSVARCARVSYLNHEGKKPSLEEDLKLYDRLVASAPIHASPAEHQAQSNSSWTRSGNFIGWTQYRKTLKDENIEKFCGIE